MQTGQELRRILAPDRVLTREIDRIAFANDASVYRLIPRVVVLPASIEEVRELFRYSRARRIPLTFRAAGTSLSGQAVTDGILAVVSRHWRQVSIEEQGRKVRVQPGAIGGTVNRHLHPFGVKIGPDPASLAACMMGGILANNSSGMCCGVVHNAYHTLESMRFVLPDGTLVDSADPDAERRFEREAPALAAGLLELKRRIESDPALVELIRYKYGMKNTNGYSLNAFLDFTRPVEMLSHLMIGSEGTLGFIAEAVLRTVPDHPEKYTGLLFFDGVPPACAAIAPLRDSGARALELMDRASLRSIEDQPGVPGAIRDLPPAAAALLVEYQCETEAELDERRRACEALLPELPLIDAPSFTRDPDRQAALWRVRKGLIPSVGAMRARGTAFIIEDVVFPVERLAAGVTDLQGLLAAYHYDDAIVFGHAKDGNLHFVLTQAFQDPQDVRRYDGFMRDLAELVARRYGGALKAEHGTGRNMAPFVVSEWGDAAYGIMRELKRLVDPDGLLNPGVLINDDPQAHLAHLKSLPTVEAEVDQCIECGFCERMCPSRDLTLTPRQRIVVRREMARLREREPDSTRLLELESDYGYSALDTCAVDGMCALACPVGIDTGKLVKRLRHESASTLSHEVAAILVERFGWTQRLARLALRCAHATRAVAGEGGVLALSRLLRALFGESVPLWRDDLPRAADGVLPRTRRHGVAAVYFPSCVSRVFGPEPGQRPLMQTILDVAARAGTPLWIPDDAGDHCCGMAFASKGHRRAYRSAVNRTVGAMWDWSEGGRLPIVLDTSPCALTLRQAEADLSQRNQERYRRLRILDGIEFAHEFVLDRLAPVRRTGPAVLHPVCSVSKLMLEGRLQRVVEAFAESAEIPLAAGCCGFAGDRGFSHPELTAAALAPQAAELAGRPFAGHYSSSRTCEIGLTRSTGRSYRSFWYLLDETTRP